MPDTSKNKWLPRKVRKVATSHSLCIYCLFFQPKPASRSARSGNCTYHKEWIDNASSATCGEMSEMPLRGKRIYTLEINDAGETVYLPRKQKVRTRLFLLRGTGQGERVVGRKR